MKTDEKEKKLRKTTLYRRERERERAINVKFPQAKRFSPPNGTSENTKRRKNEEKLLFNCLRCTNEKPSSSNGKIRRKVQCKQLEGTRPRRKVSPGCGGHRCHWCCPRTCCESPSDSVHLTIFHSPPPHPTLVRRRNGENERHFYAAASRPTLANRSNECGSTVADYNR